MYFIQPETNWRSRPWQSFNVIVDTLIAHREQNPVMTARWKRPTDRTAVENEVDAFVAQVCAQMGWTDYIINDNVPPPVFNPPAPSDLSALAAAGAKVRNIWAGLKTIGEWIDSNAPTVPQDLAESRAATCIACPKNGSGDFSKWFVAPVAGAIKRQVEKMHARNLKTSHDEKLGVCEVCTCAMAVKVHVPLDFIKSHTSDETMDKLREAPCWIPKELAQP